MSYLTEYSRWLCNLSLTMDERTELGAIKPDAKEMEARFYGPMQFGTAGLRGLLGMGLSRMNRLTVGQATQGLANLIISHGKKAMDRGVAIAYDCRNQSEEFAKQAATILAANGIKALLFDELRPTPELSFAIRHYGCIAGINVTASHNPKEYNGYKVYWEDGAQLPPAEADIVAREIAATDIFEGVNSGNFDAFLQYGMIHMLGKETDELFLHEVMKSAVNPGVVKEAGSDFRVVFTPFHGAGYRLVPEALRRLGCSEILCVPEQMKIDGNFPTVESPNPENQESFALAIELAKRNGIDLIIGTDPDADRTGVVVRDAKGAYRALSGNQIGVLLIDYLITALKLTKTMPKNPAVVKSIVTTEMARTICEANGVACFETFTGFKFIAEKIKEFESSGSHEYIFAYEESFGYLAGNHCRDKDAVTASVLITEMAAYYRTKGKTLDDALDALYKKYGFYTEKTISITMPGVSGLKRMEALMGELRAKPLAKVGDQAVAFARDYLSGERTDVKTGQVTEMELKDSNVLYYELADGTSFIIRPSGTEPKVKVYIMARGKTRKEADEKVAKLTKAAEEIVK